MKRRRFLVIHILETLAVFAAIYFEPTYIVRGTLWGDAFFEGRPTSWWRAELERWEILEFVVPDIDGTVNFSPKMPLVQRKPTLFERLRERWRPQGPFVDLLFSHPPLIYGNEAAESVLRELLEDESPVIRDFAKIGLGLHPVYTKIPSAMNSSKYRFVLDDGKTP